MRVMTFNIRGGLGMDGKRSLQRIADVVEESRPDVVCFQEIHQRTLYGSFQDQARDLQRRLDMPVVFQRNLNLGFGGEGIAIASRFPILGVQRQFLPSVRERRGVLEVRFQGTDAPFTVFCTHWGLRPEERLSQAHRMAIYIQQANTPVIVCGDLNDVPGSACVEALLAETRLQDAAGNNSPTYPALSPRVKIDYILCSHELCIETIQAIPTAASDHFPLLAEISVS